jgi:gamma-glutamyl-gamma-aminobutyrate hydrolase PuuD
MTRMIAMTSRELSYAGAAHDGVDRRWFAFLSLCGLIPIMLPNNIGTAQETLRCCDISGLILTGGDDISEISGAFTERDAVEELAISWAESTSVPILGVCRGMQKLLAIEGANLCSVEGHVATRHHVAGDGVDRQVNSYHHYGVRGRAGRYKVRAESEDGIIEWIEHPEFSRTAIMWHPEREWPLASADVDIVKSAFRV